MNFASAAEYVDKLLWGWPQITILLGTHLFMCFKTGFIQKNLFKAIKLSVTKDPDAPGDVSQFGALTTALASTVGTANIIGVGTAIALGGPGAVLWIWFTGIFGIATKYAETIIALKYRVRSEDGTMLGCLTILIMNADVMKETIITIVSAAFTPRAAGGGFIGSTISTACRYGIARGLFSNESGMGSAPLVAAAAQTRNPKRQALVSMTGTFWDTVVVCLMTGLVLVSCIIKHPFIDATNGNGSELTSLAFSTIPIVGNPVLVIGLITFTFSTMLGWYYYGERCAVYLFGEKIILTYKIIWICGIFVGSIAELKVIWNIADILNGLMTLPNIVAILLLSGTIAKETKKYAGKHLDDIDDTEIPVEKNSRKGKLL
ncbi:MAG: alanine:cation symporter family protein [Lachnospiraceae bacterium]|nr:alanine:cation symporter family protein [Lachnospiraceae bacterium]